MVMLGKMLESPTALLNSLTPKICSTAVCNTPLVCTKFDKELPPETALFCVQYVYAKCMGAPDTILQLDIDYIAQSHSRRKDSECSLQIVIRWIKVDIKLLAPKKGIGSKWINKRRI